MQPDVEEVLHAGEVDRFWAGPDRVQDLLLGLWKLPLPPLSLIIELLVVG